MASRQLGCLRTCTGKYGLTKKAGGGRVRCGNASCWAAAPNQRRKLHPLCAQHWEGSTAMQSCRGHSRRIWQLVVPFLPSGGGHRGASRRHGRQGEGEDQRKREEPAQGQEKKDNWKCPFCPCEGRPKEFYGKGRSNLNQHLMSVHQCDYNGDPCPCPCRLCGMDCGSQIEQEAHSRAQV